MASQVLWANNALTTLAANITTTQTTVSLFSGAGALFPNPGAGQFFAVTLISATSATTFEIVYCTGRAGDVLTVARGQEGTAGQAFNAGDLAQNLITAATLGLLVQASVANSWTATQTYTTSIVLDNNVAIAGKDTSGDATSLLLYDSSNFVHMFGGSAGFVLTNNAATANNLIITDSGDASLRGSLSTPADITTTGGFMRAAVGAFGSGDSDRVPILADFPLNTATDGFTRLPNGMIIQWVEQVLATQTLTTINFPDAFPHTCFAVIPGIGTTVSATSIEAVPYAQPANAAQFTALLASPTPALSLAVWFIAVGW